MIKYTEPPKHDSKLNLMPCIYFLFDADQLVYIGRQSRRLTQRLKQHKRLISLFNPKYNQVSRTTY